MRTIVAMALVVAACGAEGPAGKDGSDGADGVDGTDNKIVLTLFCGGTLEATTLQFNYSAALTTAGDVFSSGGVYGASFQAGATSYYAAGQVGAATAPVMFTMDSLGAANGGWWTLSVNRTTGVTSILYTDVDASGGSDTWTMAASACVINNF
jgi:hypothetical protein